jgi:zinc transporter ZupT
MTPQDSIERHQLEERMKSGARWFYWIAALSFITSIISLTGSGWAFLVSLGITQVVDGIAIGVAGQTGSGIAKIVALFFDVIAAGLFALIGYFASKRHSWVFLVGMAIYALDALIFIIARQWLGIAFHAFALYSMFGGYKACARLVEMDRNTGLSGAYPAPPPPDAPPSVTGTAQ